MENNKQNIDKADLKELNRLIKKRQKLADEALNVTRDLGDLQSKIFGCEYNHTDDDNLIDSLDMGYDKTSLDKFLKVIFEYMDDRELKLYPEKWDYQ